MRNEEPSEYHNPVIHELSLACWLVSRCQHLEEYWSSPPVRGQILRCCAEAVDSIGGLADELTGRDAEVAAAARHLVALLVHHGHQLEGAGE